MKLKELKKIIDKIPEDLCNSDVYLFSYVNQTPVTHRVEKIETDVWIRDNEGYVVQNEIEEESIEGYRQIILLS